MKKRVLIIIPAYNESENIAKTIVKITKIIKKSKYAIDYVIINDGSTDNTKEICKKHKYHIINLINNLGIGGAVQTGYKYAYYHDYDIAIQFDGDGQHDEKYLEVLIKEIEKGNDVVIGSRFCMELSKFKSSEMRRFGIKILSLIIKLTTGRKIYDPTSGFRAINKRVIKEFAFDYPLEFPEPETNADLLKNGYIVSEVPVEMHPREAGRSSINLTKSVYYMFSVSLAIIFRTHTRRRNR